MDARWVIAKYNPKSEEGKRVVLQASASVGYYILNPERTNSEDVFVGFLRAEDSPLPPHLEYANTSVELKLDQMKARRTGSDITKTI